MSRPEKFIDWDHVDFLLEAGCNGAQIASHFNMHPDNFYKKVKEKYSVCFTVYSTEKHQKGESLLQAQQYAKALGLSKKGDTTLLTFLGKVRLKQREQDSEEDKTSIMSPQLDALHFALEENKTLKDIINASKSQTNSELPRSDPQIQYMGGSGQIRQDLL